MPQGLDQVLAQAVDGNVISVTIASNQDNGFVSYATGSLIFHPATTGLKVGSFRPARLDANPADTFRMLFSERTTRVDVPPPPPPPLPGESPTFPDLGIIQEFDVHQAETLGVSITLGPTNVMHLAAFNSKSLVMLKPMGDLLVGLGPSFGNSAAGVFVVALTGIRGSSH